MNLAVTHVFSPYFITAATVRRTCCSGGLPAFARKAFKNVKFALRLNEVNLGRVQAAIDAKLLDEAAAVDAAALVKAGLLRRAKDGVRLLGGGELKAKVNFEVYGASKSAVAAVEKAGGSVKILAPRREEGEKAA